jgi:sn-glycerol 3-phosphate transport system substrate-binding protein
MKKLLAVLLTLALSASLFAQGATDTGSQSTIQKPAEVTFWHCLSGAQGEALEKVIDSYNEGPGKTKGIEVNLVYQGYSLTDKLVMSYQTKDTKNAPDLISPLTSVLPTMMSMDWTVDLSDYLGKAGSTISKETFYPSMVRACSYDGQMVAMPYCNSTLLLYYNVDTLNDAGFSEPPKTWDELIEYTVALTKKTGSTVDRYGLECQIKRYQLVNFCVQQSKDSFFGDNGGGRDGSMTKLTIAEDGTLQVVLEKVQRLLATGGYKYIEENAAADFAQGIAAMAFMSSSKISTVEQLVAGNFNFMTAPIPKMTAHDTSGASIGGSCLMMIDRGDKNTLNAAWDVLQYIASPEADAVISSGTGYMPVNVKTEDTELMKSFYASHPQYKVALEQMKASNPNAQEPLDLVYNDINKVITNVMLSFCNGELTVKQTIDKIVTDCDKLLDDYHEAND